MKQTTKDFMALRKAQDKFYSIQSAYKNTKTAPRSLFGLNPPAVFTMLNNMFDEAYKQGFETARTFYYPDECKCEAIKESK